MRELGLSPMAKTTISNAALEGAIRKLKRNERLLVAVLAWRRGNGNLRDFLNRAFPDQSAPLPNYTALMWEQIIGEMGQRIHEGQLKIGKEALAKYSHFLSGQ